jgi:glycosyltransferase involved in cell wall biosynthesis
LELTSSLEDTIENIILKNYRYGELQLSNSTNVQRISDRDPIVVFISTYYTISQTNGLCNILIYHDLIPEHVGMDHGPGTEYYPRIEQLAYINSVIAVSHSTSHDIVDHYGDQVRKTMFDEYYGRDADPDRYTRNTIISTVPNRISRKVFPGPASKEKILALRKKYRIWKSPKPILLTNNVPFDYFLTMGSDHPYKNFPTLFAAFDLLPDEILSRISFILSGRKYPTEGERNLVTRHPLIVQEGENFQTFAATAPHESTVPVRIQIIGYVDEQDLPALYTSMPLFKWIHL